MCGIIGIFQNKDQVTEQLLEVMAAETSHRGPDNTGVFITKKNQLGFAHNRLSILDLSPAGNQPMMDKENNNVIVFNGEIYNFKNLKTDLEAKGVFFRSNCDTEVLLKLYNTIKEKLPTELNGMFAFCIYDKNKKKLFLARDRVGIKPLYYTFKNGNFAFASEIKPLLKLKWVSKEINFQALDTYFRMGYIPHRMSIFKSIKKLEPAHILTFDLETFQLEEASYWKLPKADFSLVSADKNQLVDQLESHLTKSVALRRLSDVPIGCFLSGGLDSSLVANIMAKQSNTPIKTFNISFDIGKYDESSYARIVAKDIKSDHIEHSITINAVKTLNRLVDNFDEPFADSSQIPTFLVSEIARKYVTVVLSGDGGDELFGGYNWYSWLLSLQQTKNKLNNLAPLITFIANKIPLQFKGKHYISQLNETIADQLENRVGFVSNREKCKLYSKNNTELHINNEMSTYISDSLNISQSNNSLLDHLSRLDFKTYLPDDILVKVDRASMATSLETRVPWLDHELVEFAFSLPSTWKINNGQKKYLPKQLAKKVLPKTLKLDRKQGFSIPLREWMKDDLGDMLDDALDNSLNSFFDLNYIKDKLTEHSSGKKDNSKFLYSILNFALWYHRYYN